MFGSQQRLTGDGFEGCSFGPTLRQLSLNGLDLSRSIWSRGTFAALPSLHRLAVTGSSGERSFSIGGDVLTPLSLLEELDVSRSGLHMLPVLTRSAGGVLRSINVQGNPLDVVVDNPFANMFQLMDVLTDPGK